MKGLKSWFITAKVASKYHGFDVVLWKYIRLCNVDFKNACNYNIYVIGKYLKLYDFFERQSEQCVLSDFMV